MQQGESTPITIAYPESATSDLHLHVTVGACRLRIVPASEAIGTWVSGTYRDPSGKLPCKIEQDGANARISQEVRRVDLFGRHGESPTFDLAFGTRRPYALTIETGASELTGDFARLPLTRLVIHLGAGKAALDFSAPCAQPMSLLQIGAGAVEMQIQHVSNANAAEIIIDGGAAAYTFGFDGALQRDTHARISTGMSSVQIAIPSTTAAKVASESFLGGLQVGDGFTKREGAFWTPAAVDGKQPVLTIQTNVALGSLRLRLV